MYDLKDYLSRLQLANIGYEKAATGESKGDYFVAAGAISPHLHLGHKGVFVGLKKKRGAMTTLVEGGKFNIETIQAEIDELKGETAANDRNVANAMLELARQHKARGN